MGVPCGWPWTGAPYDSGQGGARALERLRQPGRPSRAATRRWGGRPRRRAAAAAAAAAAGPHPRRASPARAAGGASHASSQKRPASGRSRRAGPRARRRRSRRPRSRPCPRKTRGAAWRRSGDTDRLRGPRLLFPRARARIGAWRAAGRAARARGGGGGGGGGALAAAAPGGPAVDGQVRRAALGGRERVVRVDAGREAATTLHLVVRSS